MTDAGAAKKRLALFLDGTWNDTDDNTSVWRLRSLCAPVGKDDVRQFIYYDSGVGTQVGERVTGGMFGVGIDQHVCKAYEWLVENYENDDEIFIFGFSRGAFTARSLAGMLSICGLARPGAPLGVGQLYTRYRHVDRNQGSIRKIKEAAGAGKPPQTLEEDWLLRFSRPVNIMMIGVWDTVAALDLPGIGIHGFLDAYLRHDALNAFHALAIDENRYKFAPTLWTQSSPIDIGKPEIRREFACVEQRWFVGAHANVGGGYPSDKLPQLPLQWLAGKAESLGLALRAAIDVDDGAETAEIADSYASFLIGVYQLAYKRYHRPIGAAPVELDGYWVATINETIDASVFRRWQADPKYRPQGLTDWASRVGFDLDTGHGDVRADDPRLPMKR
jgi:uncharacterized protein (DUF2235 family)